MSIATVTLELLRHGDPDNQLVSPLMQYLALAGSKHEAEPAFERRPSDPSLAFSPGPRPLPHSP